MLIHFNFNNFIKILRIDTSNFIIIIILFQFMIFVFNIEQHNDILLRFIQKKMIFVEIRYETHD